MKYLKTFEAQIKEDGPHKYKIDDIVKFRPNKNKWYEKTDNNIYKITKRTNEYAHLFSGPVRSIRKNSYELQTIVGNNIKKSIRETDIRKIRGEEEIKQYEYEKGLNQELNKYNL